VACSRIQVGCLRFQKVNMNSEIPRTGRARKQSANSSDSRQMRRPSVCRNARLFCEMGGGYT
jgi:hypothetical protein